MPRISPYVWFHDRAEEAAEYYVSLFPNSRITSIAHYPPGSPGPEGSVMSVGLVLDGQQLQIINGGPAFTLTEAFSLLVEATTQDEIDHYWAALTADGGREGQCGWLRDRFGMTWQVAPPVLDEWLGDPDRAAAARTFAAMMPMTKLDLETLRAAHEGRQSTAGS